MFPLAGDLIYLLGHRLKKMTWIYHRLIVKLAFPAVVELGFAKDTSEATQ